MCACYKTEDFFLMDMNIINVAYIFHLFVQRLHVPAGRDLRDLSSFLFDSFSLAFMRIKRIRMKIPTKSTNSSDAWPHTSLDPCSAFCMIICVSNTTRPHMIASPMYKLISNNNAERKKILTKLVRRRKDRPEASMPPR